MLTLKQRGVDPHACHELLHFDKNINVPLSAGFRLRRGGSMRLPQGQFLHDAIEQSQSLAVVVSAAPDGRVGPQHPPQHRAQKITDPWHHEEQAFLPPRSAKARIDIERGLPKHSGCAERSCTVPRLPLLRAAASTTADPGALVMYPRNFARRRSCLARLNTALALWHSVSRRRTRLTRQSETAALSA